MHKLIISMLIVFSFVNQALAEGSFKHDYFRSHKNIENHIKTDISKRLCRRGNFLNETFRSYDGELCQHVDLEILKKIIVHCSLVESFSESKCMQKALQREDFLKDSIMDSVLENNRIKKPVFYQYSNKTFDVETIEFIKKNIDKKDDTLIENISNNTALQHIQDFSKIKKLLQTSIAKDKEVEIYLSHQKVKGWKKKMIVSVNPLAGNHLSLRIGNKVFEWFAGSFVSVKEYDNKRDNIVMVIKPQNQLGQEQKIEFNNNLINKLALIIQKWNSVKIYSEFGDNCQKFIKEMLEAIGVNSDLLSYQEGIGDFVKYISKAHYVDRIIDKNTLERIAKNEKNTSTLRTAINNANKIRTNKYYVIDNNKIEDIKQIDIEKILGIIHIYEKGNYPDENDIEEILDLEKGKYDKKDLLNILCNTIISMKINSELPCYVEKHIKSLENN
jgi:hypothetical protein